MALTRTELDILEQLAQGKQDIREIIKAIGKSKSQFYRTVQGLEKKGFITHERRRIIPTKTTYTALLLQLLRGYPNLKPLLSDSGTLILADTISAKTASQIKEDTGYRKSLVYRKLRDAQVISAVRKDGKVYGLNEKIWQNLKDFLEAYKSHEDTTDPRVPANSVIYYKKDDEIIFSNREELDAEKTAFSAYENYGIRLLLPTNYYYLPKKRLSMTEVFRHTLHIADKEKTIYNRILVALFYLKFRRHLKVRHPLIEGLKRVLRGERIGGYPSLEEIRDRAEVYDITL